MTQTLSDPHEGLSRYVGVCPDLDSGHTLQMCCNTYDLDSGNILQMCVCRNILTHLAVSSACLAASAATLAASRSAAACALLSRAASRAAAFSSSRPGASPPPPPPPLLRLLLLRPLSLPPASVRSSGERPRFDDPLPRPGDLDRVSLRGDLDLDSDLCAQKSHEMGGRSLSERLLIKMTHGF